MKKINTNKFLSKFICINIILFISTYLTNLKIFANSDNVKNYTKTFKGKFYL